MQCCFDDTYLFKKKGFDRKSNPNFCGACFVYLKWNVKWLWISQVQYEHKRDRTEPAPGSLLLHSGFKSRRVAYFEPKKVQKKSNIKNYKSDIIQHFNVDATIFKTNAHEHIIKRAQKLLFIHNDLFTITALSCPFGQKLKIYIRNLSQTPSVIFTLWVRIWCEM